MPTKVSKTAPRQTRRNSLTDALTDYLEMRLDPLVDQSIEIAKSNGYAPFTTTIRAAWVEAIVSVTDSLGKYLSGKSGAVTGPLATHDYAADPRFARMRQIARLHRSLGITLQMYVGLFKHFRNLYLSELAQLPGGMTAQEAARVRDFFDETELSISADWNDKSDHQRLRELQERSRAITLDKDRYFAVFESLQNPAFLLDRAGHLVNANQASAELFLGADAQAGDIIYLRSMRLRKNSLQTVIDQIMEVAHASSEPAWLDTLHGARCFEIRKRVLHDAVENTALGHVVQLIDVTAHQRRADEAQQSEQGMSRFLATMSHEIRTPLHSVLGAAELLRTADHANTKIYLDVIEGAGKALLQTLNNVLDYSKFENALPVPRPAPTDLFEEMRAFSRIATIGRDASTARLHVEIDPDIPKSATIDWGMTQQVLSNLVSNAMKADSGDGVDVSLRPARHPSGAMTLRFEVRDHGPGIPDTSAAALFRPFERTRARDTGNGGSGLGLAIAHYLVEAMDGQIGYENHQNGALVWFEFPVRHAQADPADPRQAPSPSAHAPAQARLCLLVDDDPIGAIVTTRQLERLGLQVTRAASVKEALAQAGQAAFDVFVVDYLLPDGDGPSLVTDLKQQASDAAKFLALTANVEALANRAEDFDAVLAKPAGQVGLAAAIFGSGARLTSLQHRETDAFEGLQGLSPETVSAMIVTFARAWSEFQAQIRARDKSISGHDLAATAHRLAGSCAILGLIEMEPVLRQLEAHCLGIAEPVDLGAFAPALARDLSDLGSWQRLNAVWASE